MFLWCGAALIKDDPLFSRSGTSGLFGKLSQDSIKNLKLPIVVEEQAKLLAVEAHLPFSEYLRELISISVMGRNEVERRFRARLDAIEGKGDES